MFFTIFIGVIGMTWFVAWIAINGWFTRFGWFLTALAATELAILFDPFRHYLYGGSWRITLSVMLLSIFIGCIIGLFGSIARRYLDKEKAEFYESLEQHVSENAR